MPRYGRDGCDIDGRTAYPRFLLHTRDFSWMVTTLCPGSAALIRYLLSTSSLIRYLLSTSFRKARYHGFPQLRPFPTTSIVDSYLHKIKETRKFVRKYQDKGKCFALETSEPGGIQMFKTILLHLCSESLAATPSAAASADHSHRETFLSDHRHSLRRPFPPLTKNGLGISSLSGSQIGTSPPPIKFSFLISSATSFSALCA